MKRTELVAAIAEKASMTKKDADLALNATIEAITDALKAGDKVRFSDDWVNNSPFYKTMNPDRRTFVEAHRNDVFTLAYDKNHDNFSAVFVFEEDDSEVKWLWAASELKRAEEE